jgi:hypothetical protein
MRGRHLTDQSSAPRALATVHPSSILRVDDEDRESAFHQFVQDLQVAAEYLWARRKAPTVEV